MKMKAFTCLLTLLLALAMAAPAALAADKPNILVIWVTTSVIGTSALTTRG